MCRLPDPKDVAELFRWLAAREKEAFGEIAMRLRDELRQFARRRLERNPELSAIYDEDDAWQSGLSAMWNGILAGNLAPPDGIGRFLRIARTIIGRRITAKARAERAAKRNPNANAPPDWMTGPFHSLVPDDVNVFLLGGSLKEAQMIAEDTTMWLMSLLGEKLRHVGAGAVPLRKVPRGDLRENGDSGADRQDHDRGHPGDLPGRGAQARSVREPLARLREVACLAGRRSTAVGQARAIVNLPHRATVLKETLQFRKSLTSWLLHRGLRQNGGIVPNR